MPAAVKKIRPFSTRHGWTPQRRRAQAARLRQSRPWLKSTGPKTAQGKAKSSLNATTHGARSALMKKVSQSLHYQRQFMALLNADTRARRRYRLSHNNPALKPFDIRPAAYALHQGFMREMAAVSAMTFYRFWRIAHVRT